MIEKNIDKKLAIELVTNYNSNDAHKESLVGGVQICKGGSISASGFRPEAQIRGGSKSAVTPSGHKGGAFYHYFFFFIKKKKIEMILIKIILPINLYSADTNGGLMR